MLEVPLEAPNERSGKFIPRHGADANARLVAENSLEEYLARRNEMPIFRGLEQGLARAGFACETSPILVASVENGYATAGLPPHAAMGVRYGAYISRVGGGCSAPPIGDSSIGRTPATIAPQMPRVRRLTLFIACARWERSCCCYITSTDDDL